MKTVLVIDDEKRFNFPDDWDVTYARTLRDGYEFLAAFGSLDELWLDHDLGDGDDGDTIRPLALDLAEDAFNEMPYDVGEIVICSLNIVGQKWIESTLSRYYKVSLCTSPKQLVERIGSSVAKWY
jgi:hypothetical protein